MVNRSIWRRVEQLEARAQIEEKTIEHTILFVDTDGTITDTLTLVHGGNAGGRSASS
jgi:hypothetical protein